MSRQRPGGGWTARRIGRGIRKYRCDACKAGNHDACDGWTLARYNATTPIRCACSEKDHTLGILPR